MVPSVWSSGVVPVPKTRNKGVCRKEDFQGMSLVFVVYKAMCYVLGCAGNAGSGREAIIGGGAGWL